MDTTFVKRFIERNIDAIDEKDWYKLFDSWYDLAYLDRAVDRAYIAELFNILADCDIYAEETLDARKELFKERVTPVVNAMALRYLAGDMNELSFRSVLESDDLLSFLGLTSGHMFYILHHINTKHAHPDSSRAVFILD